jgi:hypothetical protein
MPVKLKKGSAAAKAFMAKLRAAKGKSKPKLKVPATLKKGSLGAVKKKTPKKVGSPLKAKYYIEYMYRGIEQRENFETIPEKAFIKNGKYYVLAPNKITYPLLNINNNRGVRVDGKVSLSLDQLLKDLINKSGGIGYKSDRTDFLKTATRYIKRYKDKGYSRKESVKNGTLDATYTMGAVKKAASKKKAPAKSYHKDTKSHNVKIHVVSGVHMGRDMYSIRDSIEKTISQNLRLIELAKNDKSLTKPIKTKMLKTHRANLASYKKMLREQNRLINSNLK